MGGGNRKGKQTKRPNNHNQEPKRSLFRSSIELGLRSSSWKRSTTNRARDELVPRVTGRERGRPREEEEERDERERETDRHMDRQAETQKRAGGGERGGRGTRRAALERGRTRSARLRRPVPGLPPRRPSAQWGRAWAAPRQPRLLREVTVTHPGPPLRPPRCCGHHQQCRDPQPDSCKSWSRGSRGGHREGMMLTNPSWNGERAPPVFPACPRRSGVGCWAWGGGGMAKSCTGRAARTKVPRKTRGAAIPARAPVGARRGVTRAAVGCSEVGEMGSTVTLDCAGGWPPGEGTWWPPWGAWGHEMLPSPSGLPAQPFWPAFLCSPAHRAALEWGGRGNPPISP